MRKLYINITNVCNMSCPFCCMSSSPKNSTYMSFDTLYNIINTNVEISDKFIVQLEGGEPLIHPDLFLFLEYLMCHPCVEEVIIDTNGFLLDKNIDKFVEISQRKAKPLTIKPSYNIWLIDKFREFRNLDLSTHLTNIISSCEFIPSIFFSPNVRAYTQEELDGLKASLPKKIADISSFHLFNRYGKLADNESVPELTINQVYDEWTCYSSKGTEHGHDLIARAKEETED